MRSNSALSKAVEKHNTLTAREKEHQSMGTTILILKDSRYNDQYGRAQERKDGDLHVTEGKYADILVRAGNATYDLPDLPEPVEEEPVEAAETLFTDVKGVNDDINTALLAVGYTWATLADAKVADLTPIGGLGARTAVKLIDRAKDEVEHDKASPS